jgi:hypothetical protein
LQLDRGAGEDRLRQRPRVVAGEGSLARNQFVRDRSERKHIAGGRGLFPKKLLGRKIRDPVREPGHVARA